MITRLFDVTTANFPSIEEVIVSEVQEADIVTIAGYVPGGIYHSNNARWINNFSTIEIPEQVIRSKKERKAVKENREKLITQGYTFEVRLMTVADFNEFRDVYEATTMKQERAVRYSLETALLGRILAGVPIYCMGMYANGKLESGLTFTIKGSTLSVAYGAKKKMPELRGGIGGVLEYELLLYCFQHSLRQIDHGKSLNPGGFLNRSGLFEFKARYGNSAYPEGSWYTSFIKHPEIAHKELIYVSVIENQLGYVVVADRDAGEVTKAYKTRDIKNISVMSFDECRHAFREQFPLSEYPES